MSLRQQAQLPQAYSHNLHNAFNLNNTLSPRQQAQLPQAQSDHHNVIAVGQVLFQRPIHLNVIAVQIITLSLQFRSSQCHCSWAGVISET